MEKRENMNNCILQSIMQQWLNIHTDSLSIKGVDRQMYDFWKPNVSVSIVYQGFPIQKETMWNLKVACDIFLYQEKITKIFRVTFQLKYKPHQLLLNVHTAKWEQTKTNVMKGDDPAD